MQTKRESKKHAKSLPPKRILRRTELAQSIPKKALSHLAMTKDLRRELILETRRQPKSLWESRTKIQVRTRRKFTRTKKEARLPNL